VLAQVIISVGWVLETRLTSAFTTDILKKHNKNCNLDLTQPNPLDDRNFWNPTQPNPARGWTRPMSISAASYKLSNVSNSAHGKGGGVLWWACLSVFVCLSVCPRLDPKRRYKPPSRIFLQPHFFRLSCKPPKIISGVSRHIFYYKSAFVIVRLKRATINCPCTAASWSRQQQKTWEELLSRGSRSTSARHNKEFVSEVV